MKNTSRSIFIGEGSEFNVEFFLFPFHGFDLALDSTYFFIEFFATFESIISVAGRKGNLTSRSRDLKGNFLL